MELPKWGPRWVVGMLPAQPLVPPAVSAGPRRRLQPGLPASCLALCLVPLLTASASGACPGAVWPLPPPRSAASSGASSARSVGLRRGSTLQRRSQRPLWGRGSPQTRRPWGGRKVRASKVDNPAPHPPSRHTTPASAQGRLTGPSRTGPMGRAPPSEGLGRSPLFKLSPGHGDRARGALPRAPEGSHTF